MVLNEQKIARAVEQCLLLMEASNGAPLVAELEYVSQLQTDDRWTADEIKALQEWVRASRSPHNA
jgi:hypothetical protein